MPSLLQDGTISCLEFQQRLVYAVQNYIEYCKTMGVDRQSAPPIEWLDHFQEFLDLEALERRK